MKLASQRAHSRHKYYYTWGGNMGQPFLICTGTVYPAGGPLLRHIPAASGSWIDFRADQDAHWVLIRRPVGCVHEGVVVV